MLAPTLQIAEQFYTNHGVPIDEDITWDYQNRFTLREASDVDRYNIATGFQTAVLNFAPENRFYANLGFDGGVWFVQGNYYDHNPWHLAEKLGEYRGKR